MSADNDAATLNAAMQGVYHYALGRRLVNDSAPAVLLPGLDPMGLDEALRILAGDPERLRLATWTIARGLPPLALDYDADRSDGLARYPDVLIAALTQGQREQLLVFESLRARWCVQAELFSAAIAAFAGFDDCWERFKVVHDDYFRSPRHGCHELDGALTGVLGVSSHGVPGSPEPTPRPFSVAAFLASELGRDRHPRPSCAHELRRFEREVHLRLADFMRQFVDSVAFARTFRGGPGVQVLPAASITVQDTDTLVTSVTVTTLVSQQPFDELRLAMDPQFWSQCSDAFRSTRYVVGPFDLTPLKPPPVPGDPGPVPRMLEENVQLLWGREGEAGGSCRNVLRLDRLDFDAAARTIDVSFALARSVESRLLWDVRAGGVLLDEGYSVARGVDGHERLWRVTAHKTLLWSDRLPAATGSGREFGQALNYLSPAVMTWWLETQLASHTCRATSAAATARGQEST